MVNFPTSILLTLKSLVLSESQDWWEAVQWCILIDALSFGYSCSVNTRQISMKIKQSKTNCALKLTSRSLSQFVQLCVTYIQCWLRVENLRNLRIEKYTNKLSFSQKFLFLTLFDTFLNNFYVLTFPSLITFPWENW